MKILHITMHYFPIRGGQEVYINLFNEMFKKDFQIEVLQSSKRTKIKKPKNVHYLPKIPLIGRFSRGFNWFWFNFMLFLNNIKLRDADILICHYPFHYPIIQWHEKIVVVSHGVDWPTNPKKIFNRYKLYASNLCKIKSSNNVIIVANDTNYLRKIGCNIKPKEKYFKEINKNIWFIPNCVDINKYKPLNIKRENIILVPRNIRRARGIHLAIEAFYYFFRENKNYRMRIIGDGRKGIYYKSCLELIKKYKIQNQVEFLGSINNNEMPIYYNKVKLVIIPTIKYEGTSLSALEAMACGCPVVSTNVEGLKDLPTIKSNIDGKELAITMEKVLNNWHKISQMQFSLVTETFNIKNWKKAWFSVLEKLK